MAKFEIPASPTYQYLDLNDLRGLDTMSTSPNYMRATDMLNLVKKDGVHRIRSSARQSFRVLDEPYTQEGVGFNDLDFNLKFFGKIEQIENGETVPYYIRITEKLGTFGKVKDSVMAISIFDEPYIDFTSVLNANTKQYVFTNYGETGNRNGLYESIEFDGTMWVFTPIGILSFKCRRDGYNENTGRYDNYYFDVINVLNDPYIPIIGLGAAPNGTGYTKYESLNLLTDARRVRFTSDGTSTTYVLPEKNISPDAIEIRVPNPSGEWVKVDMEYTVDTALGTITFPGAHPKADGADNVEILYYKDDAEYEETYTYHGSYDEGKFNYTVRFKILGDSEDSPNRYYDIYYDVSFRPGKDFIEGTDYIGSVKFNFYINDDWTASTYRPVANILSKDTVLGTNGTFRGEKILLDNPNTTLKMVGETVMISHENVEDVVLGDLADSIVVNSNDFSVKSPAIDDTGKDLSWMGIFNMIQGEVVMNYEDNTDYTWSLACGVGIILSNKLDLTKVQGVLNVKIGNNDWEEFTTISFDGTKDIYPGSTSIYAVWKTMPYNEDIIGKKIPVKWRIDLNSYVEKEGRVINYIESETIELEIPRLNLPFTPEQLEQFTSRDSITVETSILADPLNIANALKGRFSCYYFTKCCAVYGHESNRRIFVSDGSGTDTFSGDCLDEKSTIYYFPDDNYRVLGEETEILGYAETDGMLLTFKRGDDSVYVRYGTTLDGQIQFPAMAVTKNLQILAKPIQIGNEVLVITRDGIKSITYVENEVRSHLRSYFINSYFPLWKDYEYDKMQWYVEENMLHIFLDKYEFVADLNVKSYVSEGNTPGRNAGTSTLQFQYDWYVCKHNDLFEIPKVVVYQPRDFENTVVSKVPQDLVPIGYSNKAFYRFQWDGPKVDCFINSNKEYMYYPIAARYITPFLDFGAINLAKTIKYVYLNTRATDNSAYEIGYIDENGYTETMEKVYDKITDQKTRYKNTEVPFPKLIQIKSKIKKFMNIKLYIKNLVEENAEPLSYEDEARYGDMNFDRILIQYQLSGKYRGE